MLTSVAVNTEALKPSSIVANLRSQCEYLDVSVEPERASADGVHYCKLHIRGTACPLFGAGPTETEAFGFAVENFCVKYFSAEVIMICGPSDGC